MAGVTGAWTASAGALLVPLAIAIWAASRGAPAGRFAGLMLAGAVGPLVAIALSFALDQPSSIDLALALALLTLPGTLLFALFLERWL